MKLTEDDVQKVLRIVDQLECGEVRLEFGGLKLHVLKTPAGASQDARPTFETKAAAPPPPPGPTPAVDTPAATAAPFEVTPAGQIVRAPLAGVVYHAPKPGAPPYVTVGQTIAAEDTICLVEVMKLFQSVAAGVAGRVSRVLVEDGSQVSEGQPLFAIETP